MAEPQPSLNALEGNAAERITKAVAAGGAAITAAGLIAEHPEIALAVERHRWAWKPDVVRVLLVAESHVYTSPDDFRVRVRTDLLPNEARHAPTEYVRLVYCLGYGESWLLSGKPSGRNSGTWQFWNLFGRLAGTGRQPTTGAATGTERVRWKVDTLCRLRDLGVWLLDSSLHGIYTPGGTRVPKPLSDRLHRLWWLHYGSWLWEQHSNAHRCVIGSGTSNRLTEIGARWDNWIYQPQAERSVSREQMERGWPELLRATRSP
jgi:hypothetical protein